MSPWLVRSAFTLVELMVSIVLVLMLVMGVSQIFKISSETVGAGQAISAAYRDVRGAQSIMGLDFGSAVRDGPFVMIDSQLQPAFMDRTDLLSINRANNSTADPLKDSQGAAISRFKMSSRNHHVDRIAFFARGGFRRQTGNDLNLANGAYASSITSGEAWIWIGHLALPYRSSGASDPVNYYGPNEWSAADSSNPMNNYASYTGAFASDWALGRMVMLLVPVASEYGYQRIASANGAPANMTPLAWLSSSSDNTFVYSSRYDMALTSIGQVANDISTQGVLDYTTSTWWRSLLTKAATDGGDVSYRFRANPTPVRPLNSARVALTAPLFVAGVSQFKVEFAGDFLTQDGAGTVTAPQPDGQIDFYYDTATQTKKIRWYGYPRGLEGRDVPTASAAGLRDVLPVSDVASNSGLPGATLPFERIIPTKGAGGVYTGTEYTCIWRNGGPSMVRILMKVEDPARRLKEGQWSEFVFNVGP